MWFLLQGISNVTDERYLELAKDPQKNSIELQNIVINAANKAGYTVLGWHGTQNVDTPFTVFSPSKKYSNFGDYKFGDYQVNYFTTSKSSADSFAQSDWTKSGKTYKVFLKTENPFIVENVSDADSKTSFNIKDERLRKLQLQLFFDDIVPNILMGKYNWWSLRQFNNLIRPLKLKVVESNGYYELRTIKNNSMFSTSSYISDGDTFSQLFYDQDEISEYIGISEDDDDYIFSTDNVVSLVIASNEHKGTDYDSVVIPDIIDAASMIAALQGSATDIITFKTPSQVKSADIVTYDDNGNIIPISKRFDPNKEDIRY